MTWKQACLTLPAVVPMFLETCRALTDSPFAYEAQIDPILGVSIMSSPNHQRHFRRRDFAWFFQDDWKLAKNLTINAGLRWEYFGVIQETIGNQAGLTL